MMAESTNLTRQLLQQLTTVPHRDIGELIKTFGQLLRQDPDFVSRALVWFATTSKIRDQQEAAIAALMQADPAFPEYREAGRCLLLGEDVYDIEYPEKLHGLEPYRILRVLQAIAKSERKSPRLVRGVAHDWLASLERQASRFDGIVMKNRKNLKSLYKLVHRAPNPRVQAILFDNKPPADSKLAVLKQIAASKDVKEQVSLVMQHRIPYTVAVSILPKVTPAVGVALVDVMTPQEALNSRHWVEQSGLLEIPEVKAAFLAKIASASKSAATIEGRKSAQGANAEVQAAVEKAKEKAAVNVATRITQPVLLLIDKSGSMSTAIEFARKLAERIVPICDDIAVYAFNQYAVKINFGDGSFASIQKAFRGITDGGGTLIDSGLEMALKDGATPSVIVAVTDGEDSNANMFAQRVAQTSKQIGERINVIMLDTFSGVNDRDVVTPALESYGVTVDKFEIPNGGDYNVFDNVVSLLAGGKRKSIVERIGEIVLPHRVTWSG